MGTRLRLRETVADDGAIVRKLGHKVRRRARVGGVPVSLDVFEGDCAGLVLVEIDRGDGPDAALPAGLSTLAEVTTDEAFTGAELAAASRDEVRAAMRRYGASLE